MSWLSHWGSEIGQWIGTEDSDEWKRNEAAAAAKRKNPIDYEKELKRMQYEDILQARKDSELFRPIALEQLGYKLAADGTIQKLDRPQDELEKAYYENALKAAKGELPVSPALEAELAKQRTGIGEQLSRRLGSNWQASTPGIQSMGEFDKNAGILREEARRGQMSASEGLLASRMGLLSDVNQRNYTNTQAWNLPQYQRAGLYGSAYAPYQFDRNMALQQQGIKSQDKAGWMGLLGTGIGALALLSSKDAKTDIKKASGNDEAKMLEMMKGTDVHAWKYKGDNKNRMGMLTENAPGPMVTEDGKHLDVPTYMGFLHASVKSLANKIDKMERKG